MSVSRRDYFLHMIWWTEKARREMQQENKRTGRRLPYKRTMIMDMEHLTFSQFADKLGTKFSST